MIKSEHFNQALYNDCMCYFDADDYSKLGDGTQFTSPDILTLKEIPDSIVSLRSLALAYAYIKEKNDVLTSLMYENQSDLCFQLYGIISLEVPGLSAAVLQRKDFNLDEIAILLEFLECIIVENEDVDLCETCRYFLGMAQDLLVPYSYLTKDVVNSWAFNRLLRGYAKTTPFWRNYQKLFSADASKVLSGVNYFYGQGLDAFTLKRLVCNSRRFNLVVYNVLFAELAAKPSIWTNGEFELARSIINRSSCEHIARLQNYKMMYDEVGLINEKVFCLKTYDNLIERKMAVLSSKDLLSVLDYSLQQYPDLAEKIDTFNLMKIFCCDGYYYGLMNAWYSCYPSLAGCYDTEFLEKAIKENGPDEYITELNSDTLRLFLPFLRDSRCVQDALLNWCSATGRYDILHDCIDVFEQDTRNKILKAVIKVRRKRDPRVPIDYNTGGLPVSVQYFAYKLSASFDSLTEDELEILGSAVQNTEFVYNALNEDIVVRTVRATEQFNNHRAEILRASLIWPDTDLENFNVYFNTLNFQWSGLGCVPVNEPYFKYVNEICSLDEAKRQRGYYFKVVNELSGDESDADLDFYQWCGDNLIKTRGFTDKSVQDYVKWYVFCKYKKDISNWKIQNNSPLLDKHFVDEVDWTRSQPWLCSNYSASLLNAEVPEELGDFLVKYQYNKDIIEENLKRYSLEWYKDWVDWDIMLRTRFDWDPYTAFFAKEVSKIGCTSKSALFNRLYKKYGYEQTLMDTDFAIMDYAKSY